jgi:hypothetical protein
MDVARDFPHDRLWRLRRVRPEAVPLTDKEEARREALAEEYDAIVTEHGDAPNGEVADRLDAIEAELAALEAGETRWMPESLGVAGAVVCQNPWGEGIRVERGLVRDEDAPAGAANDDGQAGDEAAAARTPRRRTTARRLFQARCGPSCRRIGQSCCA